MPAPTHWIDRTRQIVYAPTWLHAALRQRYIGWTFRTLARMPRSATGIVL